MKLKLKRPLAFLDLETTGTNIAKDRIIQIFILKIYPDGHEETLNYLVNPETEIKPEITELTGISNEDVKNAPTFKQIAQKIYNFIKDADLAGFNSNKFDIPILAEELLRAGIDFDPYKKNLIDVQVIYHKMEKRDLAAAYKFYVGKELENAHNAEADTRATYEILLKQIERYPDVLENDVEKLAQFSVYDNNRKADLAGYFVYNDKGEVLINFGKFKGQKLQDILKQEKNFYDWFMNADFPIVTKRFLDAFILSQKFNNVQVGKQKISKH